MSGHCCYKSIGTNSHHKTCGTVMERSHNPQRELCTSRLGTAVAAGTEVAAAAGTEVAEAVAGAEVAEALAGK